MLNNLYKLCPIELSQMNNVELMDRIDTKYIFELKKLEVIIDLLKDDYFVLEINKNRIFQYNSKYLDTPDFSLFKAHHRGKLNRFKFRFRSYIDSKLTFFEVKFKNNKGRTKKSRINCLFENYILDEITNDFLKEKSTFKNLDLEEKIWINYKRITLVNKNKSERVTIDLNIEFIDSLKNYSLDNLVLAEVKQDKNSNSTFKNIMHNYHIRSGSISKYCMGICFLHNELIQNNFKPFLRKINNITNSINIYA